MKSYKYICLNCGAVFKIKIHTGYSTTGCTGKELQLIPNLENNYSSNLSSQLN